MRKHLKERWIRALESKRYRQGRSKLRTGNLFCCLGVLCDVYNSGRWDNDQYMSSSVVLPKDLAKYCGIEMSPRIPFDRDDYTESELAQIELRFISGTMDLKTIELTELNDAGISFSKIADLIEKYL